MAYDATVSLKQFIQGLQEESKYDASISKSKVELISKELSFLGPFLKIMRLLPRNATLDVCLQTRVKNSVLKLKELIWPYMYSDDVSNLPLFQQLHELELEISFFSETLKADGEYKRREQESSSNYTSTVSGFIGKETMVGMHDQLNRLMDLVLEESDEDEDKLILVTGMTCIGKTALVQEIYKDPLVGEHFEAYLFLSFGPRYQLKEILLLALHQLGIHSDKFQENVSIQQLQDYVKESLSGRRYLVVLDNVWSNDSAFVDLRKNILPDDKMWSCVIVTTQNLRLMTSYSKHIHVRFLDDNESWQLLRDTIFTSDHQEKYCDPQLEKIGKRIAKNCEGLPLAIIQVGELMRDSEKTVENWSEIAEKEDPLTITSDDNTPLSNALFLSYSMLSVDLKICFLYMGVFRKKYKISRSKVVYLWISEGLVHEREGNIVEETAGEYLDDLVSRSCVLREEQRSISRSGTKTCRLHFTFRNLCVSESKKQNFFNVIRKYADVCPDNIDSLERHRRLCIHNGVLLGFNQVHEWLESAKCTRSFLYFGPKQRYPITLNLPFRILQVLNVVDIRFYEFPHQVLDLVHMRYLAITCDGELPPSISRLSILQVLIFLKYHNIKCSKNAPVYLPMEIWKLSKLKHLHCMGFDLPDPTSIDDDTLDLGMLLTLSGVSAHSCTRRILARMPRLEKIGIEIESANDSVETAFSWLGDFTSLNQVVKSFKCVVMYPNILRSQLIPSNPNFPENVRKIILSGCGFPWKYMREIGALPNLKVLKLRCYAFCGAEWEINEIKEREQLFPCLEYLLLEDLDIQHLVVKCRCFVELKCLIIRHCYKLQEIPRGLLWIDQIEVDSCSLYLVKQIQDRRINYESSADGMMIRVNRKSSPL